MQGGGQELNWFAHGTTNINLLHNSGAYHSSCEFAPPVGSQSGVWVWRLGQFWDCCPGYCAGCQSWGGLTWVKLG